MSQENEQEKQRYEKPDIKVVELVADEVLAVGCKTPVAGTGGKGKPAVPPFSCIGPTACYSRGS